LAVTESSAKSIHDLPDKDLCQSASDAWVQGSNFADYLAEAARRGLTGDACRQLLGKEPFPTSNNSASGGVKSTTSGNNPSASTGDSGSKKQSYNPFRSLSDYRDKDGLVTLFLEGGGPMMVFRDGDSMTKAFTLMHANINDPRLMMPLISCLPDSGSRASVEGHGGGYVPSVKIWIVEGNRAGCQGVVPMTMLRVQK
jgi:hypothetical protein